ncbi:hypothetical protein C8R45DRAFT_1179501 [Mycena sanguinolenta]|nr:hypothetical protein C8R45DRAFT_1179501 [Mycena sanguinolenta]
MSSDFHLRLAAPFANRKLGQGISGGNFSIRHALSETVQGEMILESNARETGDPPYFSLRYEVQDYLRNFFPNYVRIDPPPGVHARTQSSAGWTEKSVDEKMERLTMHLSSAIFDTWIDYLDPHQPHILSAVLTTTILHRLAHLIRRVFCTTAVPALDPTGQPLQEGNWEWERNILCEMQAAFEADAAGDWSSVPAISFVIDNKTQWVHTMSCSVPVQTLLLIQVRTQILTPGSLNLSFRCSFSLSSKNSDTRIATFPPSPLQFGDTVGPRRWSLHVHAVSIIHIDERQAEEVFGRKVEIVRLICGTGMDLDM